MNGMRMGIPQSLNMEHKTMVPLINNKGRLPIRKKSKTIIINIKVNIPVPSIQCPEILITKNKLYQNQDMHTQ